MYERAIKILDLIFVSSISMLMLFLVSMSSISIHYTFAKDESPQEIICDNFNVSRGQEGGLSYEDRVASHYKNCTMFYEQAYRENPQLINKKLKKLESAQEKLFASNDNFSNLRQIADYKCDEPGYKSQTAELKDNAEVISEKVGVFNNFNKSFADTSNDFYAVGQLEYKSRKSGRNAQCNTSYVQHKNGLNSFVSNAHCFYDENCNLRSDSLNNFKIKLGFNSNNPDFVYTVKSINCGTKDPLNKACGEGNPENDECIVQVNEPVDPRIKPIEKKYYSANEINGLINSNQDFSIVGFHPNRTSGNLTGRGNKGNYSITSSRTVQSCMGEKAQKSTLSSTVFIFYKCDTLVGSSGAALMYYDKQDKKVYYLGTHRGEADNSSEGNFAVNLQMSDFITSEESSNK